MSLFTDSSAFPALRHELAQAQVTINVWLPSMVPDSAGAVADLLKDMESAINRGVGVTLYLPQHSLSEPTRNKLKEIGFKLVPYDHPGGLYQVVIDDNLFIGSHTWSHSGFTEEHGISLLLENQEHLSTTDLFISERTLLKTMEKASNYLYVATNADGLTGKYQERLINLLENKQLNRVLVLVFLDARNMQAASCPPHTLNTARLLQTKNVPAFFEISGLNFELVLEDSSFILGAKKTGRPEYVTLQSLDIALQLKEYMESLRELAVRDVLHIIDKK